ncbi:helix-turn-helix domain-containing protein [Chloroflexota bacterium]
MLYNDIKSRNIKDIGQKLQDARHRLGLSQAQLAVILGVSYATISRWENDNRNPWPRHSQQISRWLQQLD